jgi:hypothetical protein
MERMSHAHWRVRRESERRMIEGGLSVILSSGRLTEESMSELMEGGMKLSAR